MNKYIPIEIQKSLLSQNISRCNKLWIAIGWQERGAFLEYKFQGDFMNSRLAFKFHPEEQFKIAKSLEEDVYSKMEEVKYG